MERSDHHDKGAGMTSDPPADSGMTPDLSADAGMPAGRPDDAGMPAAPRAGLVGPIGLVDVHCHWFVFDHPSPRIGSELQDLERAGYSGLVVMPLGGLGLPPDKVPLLLPPAYRDATGLQGGRGWRLDDVDSLLEFQADWTAQEHSLEVIPFLDVRGWDGETDLTPLFTEGPNAAGTRAGGMRGIKNILVLEEDGPKSGNSALRHVHGLSRDDYLLLHKRCFALAERFDVPMVYHVDLTLHGDFVLDCLRAHPTVRVDIPHFGLSRRLMAGFFEEFPLLFSDIASLETHIEAGPDSYGAFFRRFGDRIMLGSDSVVAFGLDRLPRYAQVVRDLMLPPTVEQAILSGNAGRFLGAAPAR